MKIAFLVLIFLFVVDEISAGSKCPPWRQLYPCRCINHEISRRKHLTVVVCYNLPNTDGLSAILPILGSMQIDKFHMYDSFWPTNSLGAAGESQKVLPNDWLTLTNIKEMEIVDSALSSCFACQWSTMCRNDVTTTFKVINSTSSDKICALCDAGRNGKVPWLSCLTKLENFQLSHGNIKSLTAEFFPFSLKELKTLILSHNQIGKIEGNAFKNLPNLKHLDLSYNSIEHIDHTFANRAELQYLDLSHNFMKMIGSDLIPLLPKIKSLNFAYNKIVEFKQSDWQQAPKTLRHIDMTGNSIRCDCGSIQWVNDTFPTYVVIEGTCSSPVEYKDSRIRVASRHMDDRCDERGNFRRINNPTKKPRRSRS